MPHDSVVWRRRPSSSLRETWVLRALDSHASRPRFAVRYMPRKKLWRVVMTTSNASGRWSGITNAETVLAEFPVDNSHDYTAVRLEAQEVAEMTWRLRLCQT